MIALISAVVGFLSSAVPEILKLTRDASDRAHELAILKLQLDYDREKQAGANVLRLEEITTQAEGVEQAALNARVKDSLTGIHWVDALSGSVRPILTYAFFTLYFLIKCAQFHLLITPTLPWQTGLTLAQALVSLWTEEDVAIFSAIMAFWFGQRAIMRARR